MMTLAQRFLAFTISQTQAKELYQKIFHLMSGMSTNQISISVDNFQGAAVFDIETKNILISWNDEAQATWTSAIDPFGDVDHSINSHAPFKKLVPET